MTFHADLAFGQSYEKKAIEILGNGKLVLPPPGIFSAWDFQHDGVSYECKADRLSARTGNLCIEYECSNRPSGISTTQADYWFIFVIRSSGYTLYKIPVGVLRELLTRDGVRKWHTDRGKSKFFLVPMTDYSDFIFREVV
jgi:hypothetical protein